MSEYTIEQIRELVAKAMRGEPLTDEERQALDEAHRQREAEIYSQMGQDQ